jgi:hypothetical protein
MKTYSPVPGASHGQSTNDKRPAGRRGALWLLAVMLAGAGGLACTSSLAREAVCPNPRNVNGCTTPKEPKRDSPSGCTFYQTNSDWLPAAYVFNATCVCEMSPDDKTADCAHAKIQQQMQDLPESIKQQGRLCNGKDGLERDACFEQFLPSKLYQLHVNAFTECCCPCGPPPFLTWKVVTVLQSTSCTAASDLFEVFGSCHGTPGQW